MEAVDVVLNAVLEDERRRPSRASIEVVREKYEGDQGVVAVRFTSHDGHRYEGFCRVQREAGRWWSSGSASSRIRPDRSGGLFAGSGGWSGGGEGPAAQPSGAYGGWSPVDGITRARLIDQSGRVVRDDVEAGVALFLWEGEFGLHEAAGELADAGGAVLRTGPLFVNG